MKKLLIILLLICISVPVVLPYFQAGYFPTHDGEWAVVRLGDMFRTLRDFQIPARYSGELNLGYGYPLFNFTYPLPYYLGIFTYVLGAGFVGSIKILFAGSVILSALFMFLASKTLWKNNWAGVVSAVLYIYLPYRMVDLYVRGSIGESLSFVLFPLLFFLGVKLIERSSFLHIGGIAIFIASLIMTHNIMTVLFLPAYVIFVFILAILNNKKAIKSFLYSILLGLGLSAFFWVPAILEKGNILLSKIPIADRDLYFVPFQKLIFSKWGYGVPVDSNGFSYQMGFVQLAVLSFFILFFLYLFIKGRKYLELHSVKTVLVLVTISAFYLFLLLKPSEFLWKNTPLLSEINYPWIIIGILGFLISLSAGFLCKPRLGKYVMIILGIVSIAMVLPYAKPERYINNPDSYYLTNSATTTSSKELMPLWVKKIPLERAREKVEIISGQGKIENLFYNSKQINFSVDALTKMNLKINTIYYPGWRIYIDKISTIIFYGNEQGVMEISIPQGDHVVQAKFEETTLRLISDIVSLLSLFTLLALIVKMNKYELS